MSKIVRLDKVNGQPVVIKNTLSENLENGELLIAKELVAGERDAYVVERVTNANIEEGMLVMVAAPTLQYDERKGENEFVIKPNEFARAYHLATGDIVTVAESIATSTVKAGDKLNVCTDGSKLAKGGNLFVVLEKENYEGQASMVLRKQ